MAAVTPESWWTAWSAAPLVTAPAAAAGVLYAMQVRRLAGRVAAWRVACFYGGLAVLVLSAVSPIDPVAEEGLFAVHMLQHVLLAEVAAPLVVLGLTGPILRPLLAQPWVRRLEPLAHPLVAFPVWAGVLVFWHLPPMLDLALENQVVHNVQHLTFFASGVLFWAPFKEVLPAPRWFGTGAKALYLLGFWVVCLVFANVLWFSGTVFYDRYARSAPEWGVNALQDQANAGSVMMATGMLIALPLMVWLFFRMARESELRQALIEEGHDPESARRAVRYGRGEALAARGARDPAHR